MGYHFKGRTLTPDDGEREKYIGASNIELINGSIEKWKIVLNVLENGVPVRSGGPSTCPLCMPYYIWDCEGCPIREYTGLERCQNTPNELYEASIWYKSTPLEALMSYAKDEITFLEKVRDVELEKQERKAIEPKEQV